MNIKNDKDYIGLGNGTICFGVFTIFCSLLGLIGNKDSLLMNKIGFETTIIHKIEIVVAIFYVLIMLLGFFLIYYGYQKKRTVFYNPCLNDEITFYGMEEISRARLISAAIAVLAFVYI